MLSEEMSLEKHDASRSIWLHLPAELRESALGLLAKLAYKCVTARTTDETDGEQAVAAVARPPAVVSAENQ